jgi:hypothetical protein
VILWYADMLHIHYILIHYPTQEPACFFPRSKSDLCKLVCYQTELSSELVGYMSEMLRELG